MKFRWNRLIILMWDYFWDSHLENLFWSPIERWIRMGEEITSQWSHLVALRWKTFLDANVNSPCGLLCEHNFILSLGNSTQNKYHGDIIMLSPKSRKSRKMISKVKCIDFILHLPRLSKEFSYITYRLCRKIVWGLL